MTRVISNANAFVDGAIRPLDLVIEAGRIVSIAERGNPPTGADIVDAEGLIALPGGVDVHVHTREPGYVHKEDLVSCTSAAAAGGYTTIFGMPNVDPPTLKASDLDHVLDLYRSKSLVDYNHNPAARLIEEIPALADRGIAAFKIYMVVDTGRTYPHPAAIGVHDHGALYSAMKAVAATGLRLMVHPHDQQIMNVIEQEFWDAGDRSPQAYAQTLAAHDGLIWDTATALLIRMAEATRCKLHLVHIQTERQIEMLAEARRRGIDVTSETNHWTIFLGKWEEIERLGSFALSYWVPEHHQVAVWRALNDGTIDMVASDHAPHTRQEKEIGWEDAWAAHTGTPGIQFQLPLMIDAWNHKRISIERVVDLVSTAPARVFRLTNKGSLTVGKDADVVLIDPTRVWTIDDESVLSKIGWTPYAGRAIRGSVVRTMVRGADVWVDGEIVAAPGAGRQVLVG